MVCRVDARSSNSSSSPYNATRADAEDVRWLVSIGRPIKALRPLSEWRRRDIAPFRVPSGSSLSLSLSRSTNNRGRRTSSTRRQSAILPLGPHRFSRFSPSADVFSCPCESVCKVARKCQGNVLPNVVCHGTRVAVVVVVYAYTKLFEKWVTRLFDVSRLFLAQKTISEFVQQQIGIWIGIWVEILGYFFSLPPSLPSPLPSGELISFTNSESFLYIVSREFIRSFTIFASRSDWDRFSDRFVFTIREDQALVQVWINVVFASY